LTTITNSHATGNVSAPNANFTGGLVGTITGGTVRLSYAEGDVEGKSSVGGLVGFARLFSGSTNILIERSYATGNVRTTGDNAGGLLGAVQLGSDGGTDIFDSFALGHVTGANYVGGLIGSYVEFPSIDSKIRRSFSAGEVTGTGSKLGGLVGFVSGRGNTNVAVIDSYWDKTTSKQTTSSGGVGKTTAEMKDISLYAGWTIADDQTLDEGYPILAMSTTGPVWKIKSVAYTPSSSGGSSSNTGSGDGSTGGSDSSGGSSTGGGSSGGTSSNAGSGGGATGGSSGDSSSSGGTSGGSSSNTDTGGGSTDSSSTGGSGTGNNGSTTDQTAGNGSGSNSGTDSSTAPPRQPTNTAEELRRLAAIQSAQWAAQAVVRQQSAPSAGSSSVAGSRGVPSSTSSQLGAAPSGSLASTSLSGGLAFVNVSQSQGSSEASTESSVQAPVRAVQVAQDGAGRDVSGFMRVFVVNGGISLPPQIHDADHR
jgi:hypothetical protein